MVLAVLASPAWGLAHTGGALDSDGCHADRRLGGYHCHSGEAAGLSFPSQAAMREALRTGNLPARAEEEQTWLQKLWPFGKRQTTPRSAAAPTASIADGPPPAVDVKAAPAPAATAIPVATKAEAAVPAEQPVPVAPSAPRATAPAPQSPVAAPTAPTPAAKPLHTQREFQERLRTIDALYKEGLLTKEEYQAKRKAVLDQL